MSNKMSCGDDRSDKVALLFEECVEINDPEGRATFLEAACAGCPGLREEVETLLRANEASGRFLNGGTPPMGAASGENGDGVGAEFEIGSRVGPYRLMGLIGEGSTSTVFLAEQEEPVRRWVALKIVKPGMDSRNVILRFGLERQALALMDHPGIAKLLDAGATSSGRPYFVMELVSGIRISSFCDEHELTLPQRLELFIQACNAVLHAHQRGIIHRDLKPDNILVSDCDGHTELKIVDFGIAKVLHSWGQEDVTRTGVIPFIGTPAYMSPEQVQMTSPELDTRTDIYSLGVVLYELLIGRPPFEHEALMGAGIEEMCRIIRTEEPMAPSERFARMPVNEQAAVAAARGTSPAEFRRALREDLDWITLKALEKSRDRRYATAAGLVEDITRHFQHLPVSAAAPSWRYRLVKSLRRNRKFAAVAAAVGVLMIVSGSLLAFMAVNARSSAIQARNMEKAATHAERQSHSSMVAMHVSSGLSAVDDRFYDKAVLWFANAALVAGPDDSQSEINVRRAMSWMSRVSMPIGALTLPAALQVLEFSPNSRFLLALGADHSWRLWDAWTQEALPWTTQIGVVQAAAWSPNDSRLALVAAGEVRIYEAADGTPIHALPVSEATATVGFTADSRYLVYGDSTLHLYDLNGLSPPVEFSQGLQSFVGLAFSEHSNLMVGVTDGDRAGIFDIGDGSDAESGSPQVFPHRHEIRTDVCSSKSNYREDFLQSARLSLPILAVEGNRLLTRTGTYEITFWDLLSGNPVYRVDGVCCSCRFISSPEAGLVACGLQGGKVGIWDIASAEPRQLLPSLGACIIDIAFGMGGKSLITAETNGMARLWSVGEGEQMQSPLHHSTDVDKVAFSPDGWTVATGQSDGLVRVWKVLDFEPDEHIPPNGEVPTVVRMDDGGGLFVLTREPGWESNADGDVGTITVFSAESGGPVGSTLMFDGSVETAAFSPDSRRLAVGIASAGSDVPGSVEFHELAGGSMIRKRIDLPSVPASLAWNPTGGNLAVICRDGELLLVDPALDGLVQWRSQESSPSSRIIPTIAFTRDGRSVISLGPDGLIEVREASSGHLRYPPLVSKPDGFWSFTLSGDGVHFATTTMGGEVAVWDLENGVRSCVLQHPGWVYRCRFGPDGETLVTAAHDGKVRLWNWRSGIQSTSPIVHPNEVFDAAITPDGRWVLTACRDGHVRIWEAGSGQILAPPLKVGRQAFNIEITRNGHHAVIGSLGKEVFILSLAVLHEDLALDAKDLGLLSEVVSGCLVQQGTIRDLTTTEWLERYERIRRLHPEAFLTDQTYGLQTQALEKSAVFAEVPDFADLPPGLVNQALIAASIGTGTGDEPCTDCPFSGGSCGLSHRTE